MELKITPREREVLELLSKGYTITEKLRENYIFPKKL